jgi:hypothetical protein
MSFLPEECWDSAMEQAVVTYFQTLAHSPFEIKCPYWWLHNQAPLNSVVK